MSKFKPGIPITVLTTKELTTRQYHCVLHGVTPKHLDCIVNPYAVINETVFEFKAAGTAKNGDTIIVVYGVSAHVGATNAMHIYA